MKLILEKHRYLSIGVSRYLYQELIIYRRFLLVYNRFISMEQIQIVVMLYLNGFFMIIFFVLL